MPEIKNPRKFSFPGIEVLNDSVNDYDIMGNNRIVEA